MARGRKGYINNDAQLQMAIMPVIEQSVFDVVEKALKLLQQIIERQVYDAYSPSSYERTYEFGDQFVAIKGSMTNHVASAMIDRIPELMSFNPNKYQHGSPINGDFREALASEIISGYNAYGNPDYPIKARPFWEEFERRLTNGTIKRWFVASMNKNSVGRQFRFAKGFGV